MLSLCPVCSLSHVDLLCGICGLYLLLLHTCVWYDLTHSTCVYGLTYYHTSVCVCVCVVVDLSNRLIGLQTPSTV